MVPGQSSERKSHGSPLFSVIVPTRERCETLRYTLATIVDQKFADLQILVSDNASEDDTPGVVHGFEDSRIDYIRAPRRMPMCDHWDFALEHANGRYIIFIGDDDGMMPGAFQKLASIIAARPYKVYTWKPHGYLWEVGGHPAEIQVSAQPASESELELRLLVRSCLENGVLHWGRLPSLYHSAISREVPDAIRAATGRVFHSTCPDVFSAFAIPVFTDNALRLRGPATCIGASPKSNSGSTRLRDSVAVDRFLAEYGSYKLHPKLHPAVPFVAVNDCDSAMVAMDLFPEYYKGIHLDYTAMWAVRQRTAKFDTIAGVIKRTRSIQALHDFSPSKFLFYRCCIHFPDQIRNTVTRFFTRRKVRQKLEQIGNPYCSDISQAVNVLARLEALS